MTIKYKKLATIIFENGIKKKVIAEKLNITPRALNNKIFGITPFTWEQACAIQKEFFPNKSKEYLFEICNVSEEAATKEAV